MSSLDPDYYAVLGIPRSATEGDIKKAYRKMALRWHPDKNIGNDQAEAEKKFKEISEAYEVLSDSGKRSQYDRFGKAGSAENVRADRPPRFSHQNPFDVFKDFFGDQNPFEDFFGSGFGVFINHGGFSNSQVFNGFGMNSGSGFNAFDSGFMQFSMPSNSRSTSVSTFMQNGNHIVKRTVVENGTTTITVEENGILKSKTVNGVAQAVAYGKERK